MKLHCAAHICYLQEDARWKNVGYRHLQYKYPKKFSDLCLLLVVNIEIQFRSLITHGKKNGEPEVQVHHQEIPSFV
jgi:hypothetical protein